MDALVNQDSSEVCPRCGTALAPDAPLGVCPSCLLAVAAAPASQLTDGATGDLTDAISSGAYSKEPARFAPGDACGSYRIVGLLGRGGMGEVYEAVGSDGRRVALKLLRQRLTGEADRARFLREGVLAASVTHRNCVYVYGSEEIDGLPIIVMELAPQGTLKHAIEQFGPRTPLQAVQEILQVVGGLEAAADGGILHRDVKPSNCFIDADGGIKVGDFGLSMSLNPSDGEIAWRPTFQGTPEFAAPEQLRGEPLDARADIYSVGATLFFLLTGYAPFGERNIKKLIDLKTTRASPDTAVYLPDIPRALDAVVGSCMASDPDRRPQTYAQLRERLRPFVTATPAPASIGRRIGALMIDSWVAQVAAPLLAALKAAEYGHVDVIARAVLSLAYFSIFESLLGGTLGKLIVGIRVTGVTGERPRLAQTAARWAIALGLPACLPVLTSFESLHGSATLHGILYQLAPLSIPAFALCSLIYASRRLDGAMLHDVWTRTRVIRTKSPAIIATRRLPATPAPAPNVRVETVAADVAQIGPFEIIGRIGATATGDLLLGRDTRLRRFVWINRRPDAPGEMPLARRQLSQATRLRWLAGADDWDAFEALDGRAIDVSASDWREMRQWLGDLSRDLEGAEAVNALPTLAADRLWRLPSGRVVLLDFRAPGTDGEGEDVYASVPGFLARLAERANGGVAEPHAVALVTRALSEEWMTTRAAAAILQKFTHAPVIVNRWQRALPILACALPAIVFAAGSWAEEATSLARFDRPDAALRLVLDHMTPTDTLEGTPETRDRYRAFIAESFGGAIASDPQFWSSPRGREFIRNRTAIEHSLKWFSRTDPREAQAGRMAAAKDLKAARARAAERWSYRSDRMTALAVSLLSVLVPIGVVAFSLSFVSSPFLFRLTGQGLEDEDGLDAGLSRRVTRAAVTWSPLLLGFGPWNLAAIIVLLAAGAIYAIASPERSIQDRIAGTFVAPR